MFKRNTFKLSYRGRNNFFIRHLGVILSIAVLLFTFVIGAYVGRKIEIAKINQVEIRKLVNKDAEANFLITKKIDFGQFWEVWEKIKEDYAYQPLDEVKMFYGAISGMVATLGDPYTVFLEPQVAEEFQQELAGKFEGIGAEIGITNGQLMIIAPLLDSPAEQAGLKAGDKILAIDDFNTKGISLGHAVKRIRGDKGTEVRLLISRDGLGEAEEIKIVRDKIVVKSVQWHMEGDFAYIRILQFGTDTIRDFDKTVKKIILKNPKGIILDLRNNPGGFLDAAVKMAGEWIPQKPVVYERYKDQDKAFSAYGKGRFKDFKTIILINKGSASGSEIVAGALKDYNKAIIVGEKTFGKGSVQDYSEYRDGSALKLTIALWLTPNKNSIDGEGIEPDVAVEISDEDRQEGKDPQLEKAKELLQ
ncbi:S41 family peptidase [Patescibacteria group bacterium]